MLGNPLYTIAAFFTFGWLIGIISHPTDTHVHARLAVAIIAVALYLVLDKKIQW